MPVSNAGSLDGLESIGGALAERVLLAAGNLLWPVACVLLFVIEEGEGAHLHVAGTVPAEPVAGATLLVRVDAEQVGARGAAFGGFCKKSEWWCYSSFLVVGYNVVFVNYTLNV